MNALHLDDARLIDYWAGDLPQHEADLFEEHLLACESCTRRLEEFAAYATGISRLAREGAIRVVVSSEFLELAERAGLRVRQYAPSAGGSVQCTATPSDDLLVARLAAGLAGASRIDLARCDANGVEVERLRDIPFNPERLEIILTEPVAPARTAPRQTLLMKLIAVEDSGERLLGTYTFNHSPYIPT